jgi:hypothetical protein
MSDKGVAEVKERVAVFWSVYERELAKAVCAKRAPPDAFPKMRDGETAEGYAAEVAPKMRRAVEYVRILATGSVKWFPDFARIDYRSSVSIKRAAKAVGVAFNRAGLNSIYDD